MEDRVRQLLSALVAMADQYEWNYWEHEHRGIEDAKALKPLAEDLLAETIYGRHLAQLDAIRHPAGLTADPDELRFLAALALIVEDRLGDHRTGSLDSFAMGAGEKAIPVLGLYGLVDWSIDGRTIGIWTEIGREFLRSLGPHPVLVQSPPRR
jgi:hypothetical protein